MTSRASSLWTARTTSSRRPTMNTEASITLGVALRVIVNILCIQNVKLGAAILGVWDGLLIHRSWIENRLFNPEIILLLLAGFAFDHYFFGSTVRTLTLFLGCGLGILLGDIGPDLWYDMGGDRLLEDIQHEADSLLAAVPFLGEESDDEGSVVTRTTRAPTRISSSRTGTSVTVRPSRVRRTPRAEDVQSGTTRLSRVTFDESSISQTQTSSSDSDRGEETILETEGDGMYMEPSTMSSHPTRGRPSSSVLRRLYMPGQDSPIGISVQSTSVRSHGDGDTTPRAHAYEFSPLPPSATVPPPSFVYDAAATAPYQSSRPQSYQTQFYPPAPPSFPEPQHERPHSPSRFERMMNVPIADPDTMGSQPPSPTPKRSRSNSPLPLPPRPRSWATDGQSNRSPAGSRTASPHRSRPPSPAGPRAPSPRPSVQEMDLLTANSESL